MQFHFNQKLFTFKKIIFPILFFASFLSGCAPFTSVEYAFDFSDFDDTPIPEEVKTWLQNGEQSKVTEDIYKIAGEISGKNRRERLYKAMDYVWNHFSYDNRLNSIAFVRTADDIFRSMELGGCSDFALVQMVLFRAVGIPSRMVITANVDWMIRYRSHPLAMTEGHSFIEVYLEDRWYLVDSTYRWLYTNYNPANKSYPHGEYFIGRGIDFWDMGIRSIEDSDNFLRKLATQYEGDYQDPLYKKKPI